LEKSVSSFPLSHLERFPDESSVIKDAPVFAGDAARKAVALANGRNPLTQPRARPGAAHPLPIVIHAREMGIIIGWSHK
jgi:hypothetical protein